MQIRKIHQLAVVWGQNYMPAAGHIAKRTRITA